MRFAVTGGAGFIGSNIVKKLIEHGHVPIVIDNLSRGKLDRIPKDVDFSKIDIRDYDELENKLKTVDGIFHEAALTDVQESFTNTREYFDVNVKGTENIFKIGEKYNIKIVYASSSSVYGDPEDIPIIESSKRNPINPYGNTKLEDELLAEKYSKTISIIGLRYFNVYGKGQTGSYAGVITKFINRLKEKKAPIIFGKGDQLRDFIFVEDIALANIASMKSKKNGFFNIGTGKATSILDIAKIMIELSGLDLQPIFEKSLQGDVQKSQADISLAINMLNWKYKTELKDGLAKFFPLN